MAEPVNLELFRRVGVRAVRVVARLLFPVRASTRRKTRDHDRGESGKPMSRENVVVPRDLAASIGAAKAATKELAEKAGKEWIEVPRKPKEPSPDLRASIERAKHAGAEALTRQVPTARQLERGGR